MKSSTLIAVNTIATYGRTVFGMAVGLFSTRWVFQTLGPVDFGLMGVVGALIIFVTFINSVSDSSCARFFAFSIGKNAEEETNNWFNIALAVHTIIPLVLIAVGWPVGEWAIRSFCNIPHDRLNTAAWVYRLSLISAFASMCFTPYQGMFKAKQKIYEISMWGLLQSSLTFVLAYSLTRYHGDAWLYYSAGTVSIMVSLGFFQVLRARRLFPECRVCFLKWRNRKYVKELFSYCGWQFFGVLGSVLRGQGSALLLNKYFPPSLFPSVNASYAVGNQVSKHTQTLSAALIGAFTPAITSAEGSGERQRMLNLANRASKFGTFLVLAFAIPLALEVNYVLVLWLKHPPDTAAFFCFVMLGTLLFEKLTVGQKVAVQAQGRIAGYMLMNGGFLILTLPLAWVLVKLCSSEQGVGWAYLITAALLAWGRVLWAKRMLGLMPLRWITGVLLPCSVVATLCMLAGRIVQGIYPQPSLFRLAAVTLSTLVPWFLVGWVVVLDSKEKAFLIHSLMGMPGFSWLNNCRKRMFR